MARFQSFGVSFLVAAILCAIPTTAAAVTFSDSNFSPRDWTPIIHVRDDLDTPGTPAGPTTSGASMTQQTTGGVGNSPYFRSFIGLEAGYAINTSGIYIDETYDPREQAISSLSFSYAVNHFNPDLNTESGILPALLQDGRLFVGPVQAFDGDTWKTPVPLGLLDASDFEAVDKWFGGPIINPDFTAFGDPIQFGYSVQNRVAFGASFQNARGVDNWLVTINLAPMSDPFGDGVGANDLALWESGFGTATDALLVDGDFDRDDDVDGGDFLKWQREHGTAGALQAANIPEPGTLLLTVCGIMLFSTGAGIVERSGRDD